jgi:hypothetical protein
MQKLQDDLEALAAQPCGNEGSGEEGEVANDFGQFLDKAKALVAVFAKSITTWRNSLRPGATIDVELACTSVVDHIVAHAKEALLAGGKDRTEGLQMLDLVAPVLKLIKNDSGSKLLQEVCDLTTAWRSKDKLASLATLLVGDIATDAAVADFSARLAEAGNLDITKEIVDALPSYTAKFVKFAAGRVCLQPPPDVELYEKVFASLLARPAFCDSSGGKAKLGLAFKRFAAAARSTIALTTSVEDLIAKQGNEGAMRVALEIAIVAAEGRPQHDILKEGQVVGHVITAVSEALSSMAEKADDVVTDSRDLFVRCAAKAKELIIDEIQQHVASVAPAAKGGTDGKPWYHGLGNESELATEVPNIFNDLDQGKLEEMFVGTVEAAFCSQSLSAPAHSGPMG